MSDIDQQALQRLLAYIDDERDERSRLVLDEAEADAKRILREARADARRLVHRAVAAQRLRREKTARKIEAEVQMRMRRAWFRLITRELDQAWPLLRERLVAHWQASPENRCSWLYSTLELAAHSLGPGLWHIEHPQDWPMLEGGAVFKAFQDRHESLQVHCRPESQPAGFRVSCADVSVSTTLDGLLARKSRVEGVWLAKLHGMGVLTLPDSKVAGDD